MREIVINRQFGGFRLSKLALSKLGMEESAALALKRDDPLLVNVVKELGDKAAGPFTTLKIVSIPDDVNWHIREYDGMEIVEEVHRIWY